MTGSTVHNAHPLARLLGGAILLCGCLAANHTSVAGLVAIPALAVIALLLHRTRPASIVSMMAAGTMFYLPVLVLASPGVALKGLSATIVGLATVSSLGPQALHDAIIRIPLPALARLLVLQMVHQAEVLRRETARIHQALVVRGGVGGVRGVWMFAKAIPGVWLPRVLFRADRVGMAMDMREYGAVVPEGRAVRWRGIDFGMVLGSLAIALAAVWYSSLILT
jgi:hypothetical protein